MTRALVNHPPGPLGAASCTPRTATVTERQRAPASRRVAPPSRSTNQVALGLPSSSATATLRCAG